METAPEKGFSYPVLTGALYTIGAIDIVIGTALVFEVYHRMGLPLIAAGVALFVITSNQQLQTLGKRGAKPPPPSEPPETSHTAQHPMYNFDWCGLRVNMIYLWLVVWFRAAENALRATAAFRASAPRCCDVLRIIIEYRYSCLH